MKRLYLIIILFAGIICSNAQTTIEGYEYWFNNDFAGKSTVAVTSTQKLLINQNISSTGLSNGLNVINFRSYDNNGRYSCVLSHFFYKTSASENNPGPEIVAYEYWLDNDYLNAVAVNIPVQQHVNINELISMSSLNNGLHTLNIRFKDNKDLWSSVLNQCFYKIPEQNSAGENKIVSYRYWFNDDFNQATIVTLSTPSLIFGIANNINLSQLPLGEHTIHFQFKDTNRMWSGVTSDIFEKSIILSILENSLNSRVLAYPNPTTGRVQIDLNETYTHIKLLIHDINGKLVFQTEYKDQHTLEFNFNEPTGIYLITLETGKKNTTIRLIKN